MTEQEQAKASASIFVRVFDALQVAVHDDGAEMDPSKSVGLIDKSMTAFLADAQHRQPATTETVGERSFPRPCVRLAETVVEIMDIAASHHWPLAEAVEAVAIARIEEGGKHGR